MPHLTKAIKDAYEAGYKPAWIDKKTSEHWFGMSEDSTLSISQTLLDPDFWKFCGKARGWEDTRDWERGINGYLGYWHHFIDHLAEGKDAESFFAELLK